jgi:hypothetical protein
MRSATPNASASQPRRLLRGVPHWPPAAG